MMADDTSTIQGRELKNTVILALSFTTAYTAFNSLEKLQSSLHQEDNLGVISLSVVYGTFILFGFFAPTIIKFIGVKNTFIIGWVVHLLYTASNFYPDYRTLIPSSVLFGGISALLWTSQSTYVTACAYSLAKHTSQAPYATLTKLMGIFFAIVELNGVMGNLIASLVLQQGTYNQTEKGSCGTSFCPVESNGTTIEEPEEAIVYILLGIYLAFDVIALVTTAVFLSPLPKSTWTTTTSLKESLTSFFVTLFTTKLIFLVPFMIYLAMEQSFLAGDYTVAYISCPIGIKMIGFVLTGYSVVSATFNLIVSHISKYTGRYILIAGAAVLQCVVCMYLYRWVPYEADEVVIFLIPGLWAVSESVWISQSQTVIALFFPDQKEPAFANYHAWKSIGSTLTFALSSTICAQHKLLTIIITLGIAMIFYAGVEIHFRMTQVKATLKMQNDTPSMNTTHL